MASSYHEMLERIKDGTITIPRCDFRRLKDELTILRKPEDNIRYRLNRTSSRYNRTESNVNCEELWDDMEVIRKHRLRLIASCEAEYENHLASFSKDGAQLSRAEEAEKGRIKFERGFLTTERIFEDSLRVATIYNFEHDCASFNEFK